MVALNDGAICRIVGPGRTTVPVMPLTSRLALGLALLMAAVLGMRAQRARL